MPRSATDHGHSIEPQQAAALVAAVAALKLLPAGDLAVLERGCRPRRGRIAAVVMDRLWQRLASGASGSAIGVALAEQADLAAFGVLAAGLRRMADPLAAYHHLGRHGRLLDPPAPLTIIEEGRWLVIEDQTARPADHPAPAAWEARQFWRLAHLALLPRRLFGLSGRPHQLISANASPPSRAGFHRLFGPSLRFGADHHRLIFAREDLSGPACLAPPFPSLPSPFLPSPFLIGAMVSAGRGLAPVISTMIAEQLAGEPVSCAAIADQLALPVRSLQRRLHQEGTSFAALLDRQRRDQAARLLAGSTYSIAEIAYLLGYGEPAVFSRAARRWFGETARDKRSRTQPHRL